MTLHDLIQSAYPGANPRQDYIIQDDGAGPYLAVWAIDSPIPKGVPTMAINTPMARWQALSLASIEKGVSLVDGLAPHLRLEVAVLAAIAATAEGDVVEGGQLDEGSSNRHSGAVGCISRVLECADTRGWPDAAGGDEPVRIEKLLARCQELLNLCCILRERMSHSRLNVTFTPCTQTPSHTSCRPRETGRSSAER
jgi:hypothetical protein